MPPLGIVQAPSWRPAQYGPPGCASRTSVRPSRRRNNRSPALSFCAISAEPYDIFDQRVTPGRPAYLRRSALPITDTELKLIAAAAMTGLSSNPKNGYNTPAAMGTPAEL